MVGEMEVKEKPRPSPDYLMQLMNDRKLMSSLPNLCGIFTHLEWLLDEGLTRGRGVTETVRLQWIYSMHKCAGIHDAMTTMTNLKHKTSEQHIELGTSRSNRDFQDLSNIQEWFNQHEPFDLNEQRLRSLSFGHGKTSLLKKIKQSEELQHTSSLMSDPEATVEQIGKAGIRLFVVLYGGREGDFLNCLRFAKFMEMVSSNKTSLDPQKLPPTERAAYFHSLRVHLQVILWCKLTNNDLDPKQWGWKHDGTILTPVLTDLDAAPQSLLKFVRCKCKLSSRNPCGNNVCSCRKNGLKCVTACGDCRGESCQNVILDDEDSMDTNEENVFQ